MKSTGGHILEPRVFIDVYFNLPTASWRGTPFANKTSKGTQGKNEAGGLEFWHALTP